MVWYTETGGAGGTGGTTDLLARQIAARIVATPSLTPDVQPGAKVFHAGVEYVNPTTGALAIPDPVTSASMIGAGFIEPVADLGDRPTRFVESAASATALVAPYSYVHVTARGVDRNVTLDDSAELGARVRLQYVNLGGEVTVQSGETIMRGAGATAVTVPPGDQAALNAGASGSAWLTRTVSGWWIEDRPVASAGYDDTDIQRRLSDLENASSAESADPATMTFTR